jgi:hypothetical protein
MAFHLTDAELERAKNAIEHHGYAIFFPRPPEWETVLTNWDLIRAELAGEDLDLYQPREPLRSYAPKSRINLRPVTLLHPYDTLIYTALVLIVRDDLEAAKDPAKNRRVFSHRAAPTLIKALYDAPRLARESFRKRQEFRANRTMCSVVAVTDIADFFPRVLQHRLENIIRSAASSARATDVARVLVKKFLLSVAGGDSYGLPIGPLASSVLAEAILIDVDAALIDQSFDFVRWFDDYTFFSRNDSEAQRALFFLAKWLHDNHGLSLSAAKTKILRKESFLKGIARDYEQRIKERSEELADVWASFTDYTDPSGLTDEQRAEIEAINLAGLLSEALNEETGVDYEFADLILGKLASAVDLSKDQAVELSKLVIKHLADLYPIISSVATFFKSLRLTSLPERDREKIAKALLAPLRDGQPAIAWHLSTAAFYKAGGRPWKVAGVREGVCYVGLVFKQENRAGDPRNACCAAQMFLASGDGVVFKGAVGPWYSPETGDFHVSTAAAHDLVRKAIDAYKDANNQTPPRELFLHVRVPKILIASFPEILITCP